MKVRCWHQPSSRRSGEPGEPKTASYTWTVAAFGSFCLSPRLGGGGVTLLRGEMGFTSCWKFVFEVLFRGGRLVHCFI